MSIALKYMEIRGIPYVPPAGQVFMILIMMMVLCILIAAWIFSCHIRDPWHLPNWLIIPTGLGILIVFTPYGWVLLLCLNLELVRVNLWGGILFSVLSMGSIILMLWGMFSPIPHYR